MAEKTLGLGEGPFSAALTKALEDRGSALLRRQCRASKEPYGVKEVTIKNTPMTTSAAATM